MLIGKLSDNSRFFLSYLPVCNFSDIVDRERQMNRFRVVEDGINLHQLQPLVPVYYQRVAKCKRSQ